MAIVSASSFKRMKPEFKEADNTVVENCLSSAEKRISATAFGSLRVEGIVLLAAHLLSMSPDGEQARLKLENRGDMYMSELKRLKREVTMGIGRVS